MMSTSTRLDRRNVFVAIRLGVDNPACRQQDALLLRRTCRVEIHLRNVEKRISSLHVEFKRLQKIEEDMRKRNSNSVTE